jgi:hypothetical protein
MYFYTTRLSIADFCRNDSYSTLNIAELDKVCSDAFLLYSL